MPLSSQPICEIPKHSKIYFSYFFLSVVRVSAQSLSFCCVLSDNNLDNKFKVLRISTTSLPCWLRKNSKLLLIEKSKRSNRSLTRKLPHVEEYFTLFEFYQYPSDSNKKKTNHSAIGNWKKSSEKEPVYHVKLRFDLTARLEKKPFSSIKLVIRGFHDKSIRNMQEYAD